MIVYNVTIKVQNTHRDNWLKFMTDEHIPAVLATGCFTAYRMHHLLDQDDSEDTTYVIQYIAPDMQSYLQYKDDFAPQLQADTNTRFKDKFVAFRTLMRQL